MTATRQLVYFADPMCSWCYGFSPAIAAIAERFAGRMPVRVVVGGLRAGNTQPMRPQDKDYIRDAWARVGEASGQPFDTAFFEREGFVYDTEPACRAVVAMRTLKPEAALAYMGAVSRAFYALGEDTTRPEVLAAVAGEFGVAAADFEKAMLDAEVRNATFQDFMLAQQSGVTGFPCLVVGREPDGYALVTGGFRPLDDILEPLEAWYAAQTGAA